MKAEAAAAAVVESPSWKVWFQATRPKTLVAGLVPVAVGSAVAFREGHFVFVAALVSLIGALLIQIGTNLTNDYYDFKKGADTADRLGPARVTQQGLIAPGAVLRAAIGCFVAAVAIGMYLVSIAGLPILIVGLISVLAGYAYTGGPFPLGYHGLGDVFVLVFFGFVAVGGTYFVQALTVSQLALWCAVPVGLLGVALLAVNNVRDRPTDTKAGKRTLVVRFGVGFGRGEYAAAVAISFLIPVVVAALGLATPWVMVSWLALPLAISPLKRVFTETGASLNLALAATARLQLVFGLLFSLGLSR